MLNIPLILAVLWVPLQAQAPEKTPVDADGAAKAPARAPLLTEGTIITDVQGVMYRDSNSPLWRFRVDPSSDERRGRLREFVLLPCRLLEEMEMKADSAQPGEAIFNLSGEVLNYGRENWLLPQHVEWITTHAERNEPDEVPDDPSSEVRSGDPSGQPGAPTSPSESGEDPWDEDEVTNRDQGDSIADIVASLQQSVGPLRRSIDTGETTTSVSGPREGQLLVSRRGRLGRGPTGAWVWVQDSDVNGLSDPSLILLPSRKTAELEAYGGYGWLGQPMLISGEVFTYRGRHFLRPTAWKIVRERPNLIR